jgi:hypothetical protein
MTGVCTRGLRRFTKKPSSYLVEPQNQDRRLGGQRRDLGASISFDACGRVAVRGVCVRRTRSVATAWPCDEEECYMTYLPLRGCITT